MGVREPNSLDFPPFPVLTWDGYSWTCTDTFPAWAEFQRGRGSGYVSLYVATDDAERSPPTAEQCAAYRFLKENDDSIARKIANRIFHEYPALRRSYEDFFEAAELAEIMPAIQSPEDLAALQNPFSSSTRPCEFLKPLIGVVNIYIHRRSSAGVAYVGFELECTWDAASRIIGPE